MHSTRQENEYQKNFINCNCGSWLHLKMLSLSTSGENVHTNVQTIFKRMLTDEVWTCAGMCSDFALTQDAFKFKIWIFEFEFLGNLIVLVLNILVIFIWNKRIFAWPKVQQPTLVNSALWERGRRRGDKDDHHVQEN